MRVVLQENPASSRGRGLWGPICKREGNEGSARSVVNPRIPGTTAERQGWDSNPSPVGSLLTIMGSVYPSLREKSCSSMGSGLDGFPGSMVVGRARGPFGVMAFEKNVGKGCRETKNDHRAEEGPLRKGTDEWGC